MKGGIDHTLLPGYSLVAGIGKLANLRKEQMAQAPGIAGTSISPTGFMSKNIHLNTALVTGL
jgi:2-methylcitrate dehydratase PrpD